ncbi:hypothetical protein niasHT_014976 [Heterodera trifolii]|uniref:Uncharacterized protein n=1 Tax=Heterodera trifolii TaxID=157864 RepID=A0ABD2L4V4_9BILA
MTDNGTFKYESLSQSIPPFFPFQKIQQINDEEALPSPCAGDVASEEPGETDQNWGPILEWTGASDSYGIGNVLAAPGLSDGGCGANCALYVLRACEIIARICGGPRYSSTALSPAFSDEDVPMAGTSPAFIDFLDGILLLNGMPYDPDGMEGLFLRLFHLSRGSQGSFPVSPASTHTVSNSSRSSSDLCSNSTLGRLVSRTLAIWFMAAVKPSIPRLTLFKAWTMKFDTAEWVPPLCTKLRLGLGHRVQWDCIQRGAYFTFEHTLGW